jgi:hypothetical protein
MLMKLGIWIVLSQDDELVYTEECERGGCLSLNELGVERPGGIHGRGFQASWWRHEQVLAESR